jgi:teichoic acid transport system ATP-binding protein
MSAKYRSSIAVNLRHVSKTYTLHHEKPTLIESVFKKSAHEQFVALDDVSLSIHKGEKVGLIGPNGAGKTTLLKTISGISTPNKGVVKTHGSVVSLIDLEAGFHPDLSGIENIFLNGMIIGMTKEQIKSNLQAIMDFADIGRFIDAPLYTYSQGMKLRLGFAVAIHADPDILILDEGFSTGDEAFRKKSDKKINEIFKQNKTIIIASHWLEYLKKNVQRIIWVDEGKIKADTDTSILNTYYNTMLNHKKNY